MRVSCSIVLCGDGSDSAPWLPPAQTGAVASAADDDVWEAVD